MKPALTTPVNVTEGRDDDSGKFTEKWDRGAFVAALREHGGAAGTAEVAESVGCPHRTALYRLRRLSDEGVVASRKVGGALLWSLTERGAEGEGEDRGAGGEGADTDED